MFNNLLKSRQYLLACAFDSCVVTQSLKLACGSTSGLSWHTLVQALKKADLKDKNHLQQIQKTIQHSN
ncbi:hypothetical protein QVD17_26610 [Tagetes erecta]|uniref:Uncharacterized protein n=1 Tax=Tagetes erecta TaxID=13708 RepID=A0AAD8NQH1_TARER|nr:hypothetical protein QVD17_26610 [Tagetes erecta]